MKTGIPDRHSQPLRVLFLFFSSEKLQFMKAKWMSKTLWGHVEGTRERQGDKKEDGKEQLVSVSPGSRHRVSL